MTLSSPQVRRYSGKRGHGDNLPLYRPTAYLWTQLVSGRFLAMSPNALFALRMSGRSWKLLLKWGPQAQSTDAQT